MPSDVVLTSALRTNLLSLQSTQSLIDQTQERLSTGKKVNSALDGPQSYFTAQGLSNRASDLSTLLDGIGQSIRTLEQADAGIPALSDLLNQASSIADQARTELSSVESSAVASSNLSSLKGNAAKLIVGNVTGAEATDTFTIKVGSEAATTFSITASTTLNSLVAQINDKAATDDLSFKASLSSDGQLQISSTNGEELTLDDTAGNFLNDIGMIKSTSGAAETFTPGGNVNISLTGTGTIDAQTALADLDQFQNFGTTGSLSFTVNGVTTAVTLAVGTTTTIDDLVDLINANPGLDGLTASFDDTTDTIKISTDSTVEQFTIATATAGTFAVNGNLTASTTNTLTFRGGDGSSNTRLKDLADDYNEIRRQIDSVTKDANYRGINLLGGDDMTTIFNEDGSSSLTTQGVNFSAAGLGLLDADFSSSSKIQESIDQAKAALESVRSFGNSIANDLSIIQTRQSFTSQTISTLEAGADDLTLADANEEGANLLALQTRQQLGVTALSLASQSQQSVLSLF